MCCRGVAAECVQSDGLGQTYSVKWQIQMVTWYSIHGIPLPRASYRNYCPPNDLATWKAAVCQDLVIIMVITRADWSSSWWQWAASEFLSLGLRHRELQNNGWGFSQVGAVGTMEAFRSGKGFLVSINSLWIRERIMWINFTINLKGAPLFQGRGTETKPWKAMKIEFPCR